MDSSLVEGYKEEDEELEGSYDSDHILSSLPKDYKSDKGVKWNILKFCI